MHADHLHVDPRPVGTRRLMMLTPDDLTANQSEECPQADRTPTTRLPHPVFKNLSLKAFGEFELFKH